ncbi:type II toxin-antitoxin system HicA family toxin [Desulfoscipio gibsoniae]|uniref:YcfA-like protein n=1 Tax=Desulfoscipio gibsoniae DSM 7213 TaxID=767817 RepID=R4KLA7_9FIRM|nr:type II toxin-antitoxin system HicA family toxin [Desulfoscipio gibsoniae]AGL00421.1 YcfA-like protein [Desulfoscipio gibsoniae DSM 7213]
MTKLEKLLEKIKNNPRHVRFEELDKILIREGFKRRQPRKGSSHYIYRKGNKSISIPHNEPHIKSQYVKEVISALEGVIEDE